MPTDVERDVKEYHEIVGMPPTIIQGIDAGRRSWKYRKDLVWNSQEISESYYRATLEQRAAIDLVFLSFCGWELGTIIAAIPRQEEPAA